MNRPSCPLFFSTPAGLLSKTFLGSLRGTKLQQLVMIPRSKHYQIELEPGGWDYPNLCKVPVSRKPPPACICELREFTFHVLGRIKLPCCPRSAECAKDKSTCTMPSHLRVGASSGLGKERMRLLGQSPSPEKAQYGWRF
jgi:hypothetical protein